MEALKPPVGVDLIVNRGVFGVVPPTPPLLFITPYHTPTYLLKNVEAPANSQLTQHLLVMAVAAKKTVLVIGGGAVGAVAALNIDIGGLAEVTIVLRSNYEVVKNSGYNFESCDHGSVEAWKPSVGRLPSRNTR
jgi:NADPH-dependent 2,4-dienoyl-CoA reductase/sulfur reductase-like enzyme